MQTQVVIPAFNEEKTIASIVHLSRKHADEVLVVDDGSTDRTADLAQRAGARTIRLPENQGKGRALRTGVEAAQASGADIIVTLDADGQHDPEEIPTLVGPIRDGSADLVIGSRRLTRDQRRRIPIARRLGQFLFTRAASTAADMRVTDSESGYRAYRASVAASLRWAEEGYGTEWETLQQARANGARVVEVPIGVTYLAPNASRARTVTHAWNVGASIVRYVRSERPLLFLGLPGALLLAVGFVLGLQTATHYYGTGEFWPGKAMLSMLTLILGALAVFAGLVLDAIALMFRRSGSPPHARPPPP